MSHFTSRVLPLVLGLLGGGFTGCTNNDGYGGYDPGWGQGIGGQGGPESFGCHQDSDCGNEVCARDGECLPASAVRTIHVNWTLDGVAASPTSCDYSPDLDITFYDNREGDTFGFAPVPCAEGKFTVDKLPINYSTVNLEVENDGNGGSTGTFDGGGTVALDLPY